MFGILQEKRGHAPASRGSSLERDTRVMTGEREGRGKWDKLKEEYAIFFCM